MNIRKFRQKRYHNFFIGIEVIEPQGMVAAAEVVIAVDVVVAIAATVTETVNINKQQH